MDQTNQNTPRFRIWEPTFLALAVVIGMVAGASLLPEKKETPIILKQQNFTIDDAESIADVIRYIDAKYVDEVHSDRLIEKAIQSILAELDPHSSYISPNELRDHDEKMRGNFEGIGIEFHMIDDTLAVMMVVEGGPAEKAGLVSGDKIVAVNDSLIAGKGIATEDLVSMLKGKKGSHVDLGIVRGLNDSLFHVRIQRGEIPIPSVLAGFMLNEYTGYIKVARFSANTYKEFMAYIEDMVENKGMKHLVLDLRENPGGYLNEAVNMLSQLFREKNKLLVYTEGNNSKRTEYKSTGKPFFEIGNVAVLINGSSASASEIVAGALQDHDRGVIIGQKSYGKGLVQEHYSLQNGGALRLTIARYYTPSGRLIQTPYVIRDGQDSTELEQPQPSDTSAYFTSNGREVLSEGGITPDIVVDEPEFWSKKGLHELYDPLVEYVFRKLESGFTVDANSVEELRDRFPTPETIVTEVKAHYKDRLSEDLMAMIDANANDVAFITQAMVASKMFGREAWYEVMQVRDPYIEKALSLIEEDRKVTLKL